MKKSCTVLTVLMGLAAGAASNAATGPVRAASVFGHDMVLQRDTALPVWGRAAPGTPVTVSFGGARATARADDTGAWRAVLPPQAANAEGATLRIADAIAFTNVVVGDVWIFAGSRGFNQPVDDAALKGRVKAKGTCPQVRVAGGGCYTSAMPVPCDRISWNKWTPATEKGLSWRNAANCAAAYTFARELFDGTGVPQGVIRLDWVWLTGIDAFLPDAAYALEPELAPLKGLAAGDRARLAAWMRRVSASGVVTTAPVPLNRVPPTGAAWNAVATGVAGFAARGAVWAQDNLSLADETPGVYRAKLRALVRSWRLAWGAKIPFAIGLQNVGRGANPCSVPGQEILRGIRADEERLAAEEGLGVSGIVLHDGAEDRTGHELSQWAREKALRAAPMPAADEKPVAAPAPAAEPELSVLEIFTSHMVLQRGKEIPVTGRAKPHTEVTVSFAGCVAKAMADGDGAWKAVLPALEASAEPRTMTVKGAAAELRFDDVLVGDVWLVSGQSNAEFPIREANGCREALEEAGRYPAIRAAKFRKVGSTMPVGGRAANRAWVRCTAETLPPLSAVGYYFAKEINSRTGVPVGILDDNWGGRKIESFLDPDYVRGTADPALADLAAKSGAGFAGGAAAGAAALEAGIGENVWFSVKGEAQFGYIHNAMIAPVTGFPIAGAVWYQGCSNSADSDARYAAMLRALIGGWRGKWGGELPVYIVQLQSHGARTDDPAGGDGFANVRNAQFRVARDTPGCGLAVCADIGLTIHPGNKPDLAARLARWARRDVYGEKNLVVSGPMPRRVVREGSKLRIFFDHAGTGLVAAEYPAPNTTGLEPVPTPGGRLKGFSIAGKDGRWAFAEAVIDGGSVVLSSPEVAEPTAVRYGHLASPWGTFNLYNREGLPAPMFALEAERPDENANLKDSMERKTAR